MWWGVATALAVNLIVGLALFRLAYDSARDYTPVEGPIQCLKLDNPARTLCAQCFSRPADIQYDKGMFLDNRHPVSLLELPASPTPLSCAELLQLVTVSNEVALEGGAAGELVAEVGGDFSSTRHPHMSLPSAEQLVVYRWFGEGEPKSNNVFMPNPDQVTALQHAYLWVLNAGLFLLFAGEMSVGLGVWELPLSIKWVGAGLVLVLEGVCLGLGGELLADVGRVLLMVGALSRLDVEKGVLGVLLVVGGLMSPSELTYSLFVLVVYLTVLVKGLPQLRRRQVWLFLLLSYFVYTINQFVWYFLYEHAADTPCRLVELHLMVTTPLAFLAIPDLPHRHPYRSYTPYDPENRAISLSGFEEVEDDDHETQ